MAGKLVKDVETKLDEAVDCNGNDKPLADNEDSDKPVTSNSAH